MNLRTKHRDFDIKLMVVQKDEKGYQGGLGEN